MTPGCMARRDPLNSCHSPIPFRRTSDLRSRTTCEDPHARICMDLHGEVGNAWESRISNEPVVASSTTLFQHHLLGK